MDVRIFLPYFPDGIRKERENAAFTRADMDIAANAFSALDKFRPCLVHHIHYFFGALAQTQAIGSQGNAVAMPVKQLCAQFILQFPDLARKRRYGSKSLFGWYGVNYLFWGSPIALAVRFYELDLAPWLNAASNFLRRNVLPV